MRHFDGHYAIPAVLYLVKPVHRGGSFFTCKRLAASGSGFSHAALAYTFSMRHLLVGLSDHSAATDDSWCPRDFC